MKLSRPLILASSSPRRQYLMREAGLTFEVRKPDVEEVFPKELPVTQVAKYLASVKAEHFRPEMREEVIVTADTVVILGNRILNKPTDRKEAIQMLTALSGKTHVVMTGVSIVSREKEESFDDSTDVTFEHLSRAEIEFYIDNFRPYDKAGAYGAQDCLPSGINPCSIEETKFLREIHNENLIEQTMTKVENGIVVIKQIAGSYFNVMGLPIHKVYEHLRKWS
jgi:septum formation protein